MAHDTRVMFGQSREGDDVDCGYKDAGAARIFKGQSDVNSFSNSMYLTKARSSLPDNCIHATITKSK